MFGQLIRVIKSNIIITRPAEWSRWGIYIRGVTTLQPIEEKKTAIQKHTTKKIYPFWYRHHHIPGDDPILGPAHKPLFSNHQSIMRIGKLLPDIADTAFIAPSASVIGDVQIAPDASIWYSVVLRGDFNRIMIGDCTNIQDGTVIHESFIPEGNDRFDGKTIIKNYVTIGHNCLIGGCTIESEAFIGMGTIIGNGVVIEKRAMIAMGSVVPPHTLIPKGQLWGGNPLRFLRDLTELEKESMVDIAERYSGYAKQHKTYMLPSKFGTQYLDAERLRKRFKKNNPI